MTVEASGRRLKWRALPRLIQGANPSDGGEGYGDRRIMSAPDKNGDTTSSAPSWRTSVAASPTDPEGS